MREKETSGNRAGATVKEGIFTRYLSRLDPSGEPPDADSFNAVREALRGALRKELGRRGLWQLPPSFLGVHGHERWSLTPPGDALDELTADGYVFVFIDRMASLRSHLRLKPNVDGLVFLNVRHFVHERQRRHDPLGARVYSVLRSAVSAAVVEGDLHVVEGDPTVRSDTVLALESGAAASDAAGESELRHLVVPWMDALLPDLVTTRGKGHSKLVERARDSVLGLASHGVTAFAFQHLAAAVKLEVRGRWAAVFELPGSESPDMGYEEREELHRLMGCVDRELAALGVDEKTASFARTLWEALRSWACDPVENRGEELLDPGRTPSQREVSRVLGIPRDRLPGLYEMLGDIFSKCRAAAPPSGAAKGTGAKMDHQERWNRLRQATGEAVIRAVEAEHEAAATPAPGPGDVYLLRASGDEPLEWVVLDLDSADRVVAVPADTRPLAGSADFPVTAADPAGPLTLRCAHGVSLPAALFEAGLRSRRLSPAALAEARRLAAGARAAEREEVDVDADYREQQEEVARVVRAVVEAAASRDPGPGSAALSDHQVTRLLQSWSAGSLEALDEMIPLVFDDLHRMACYFFQREPDSHTLQPTALIHLLYLRLRGMKNTDWSNREDFFHFAAGLMRHVLVDYARRRRSKKRGGEMARIPLSLAARMPVEPDFDFLALDLAIEELAKVDARQARIVELRYFVGLNLAEIAELQGISEATVKRELRTARFWLHRRISADRDD